MQLKPWFFPLGVSGSQIENNKLSSLCSSKAFRYHVVMWTGYLRNREITTTSVLSQINCHEWPVGHEWSINCDNTRVEVYLSILKNINRSKLFLLLVNSVQLHLLIWEQAYLHWILWQLTLAHFEFGLHAGNINSWTKFEVTKIHQKITWTV